MVMNFNEKLKKQNSELEQSLRELENIKTENETLKEYLEDYASADTRAKGEVLIQKELKHIPNPKIKEIAARNLKEIIEGKRDFRF